MKHGVMGPKAHNHAPNYWYWLARPEVDAEKAIPLIAGIEPSTLSEFYLDGIQKAFLAKVKTLVEEAGLQKMPILGWLRWAVEHPELSADRPLHINKIQEMIRAIDCNTKTVGNDQDQLSDKPDRPIHWRERETFERLIYVLAKEAGYQFERPYSDEEAIKNFAASIGTKVPEGKGIIAGKLTAAIDRVRQDKKP